MTSLAVSLMTIDLSANLDLKASDFDLVRFQIIKGVDSVPATPSVIRRAAIPSPMIPRPMNPTDDDGDDDIFNARTAVGMVDIVDIACLRSMEYNGPPPDDMLFGV
mmetsp:Transcript_1435/g.3305  ORF Transcript_1435/g.3305 Transcript_1435/m.3305 type:complete len:106 (-) Transcript_1435:172-489(-)